jgi:hypothetical protein
LLRRWNARANQEFVPAEFTKYYGAINTHDFVEMALTPKPRLIPDLTYVELLAVFERVVNATPGGEAENSYFLGWLEAQFPDSNVSDLIDWSDQWFGAPEALKFEFPSDQLLRALMEYSGRVLSGAPVVAIPFEIPKKRLLVTPPPSA